MEEYSNTVNNEPVNQEANRLKTLAFPKTKISKIIFAIILFFLLLSVLNYFNIFSVSDAFPNQLGWLPHQQAKTASRGDALQSHQLSPTPGVFQYDSAKAKTLLTRYIKDEIKPELLPEEFEVKQNYGFAGRPSINPYEFGWNYSSSKATISATLNYKENTNNITLMSIVIATRRDPNVSTPTASLANSLFNLYFNNPIQLNEKDCGTYQFVNRSYCGKFDIKSNEKIDYVLEGLPTKSAFAFYVISCFIPKNSEYFEVQEHCMYP